MNNYEYGENEFIGNDLSAVTFVRDYIQLQFNSPPTINALTKMTVIVGDFRTKQGDVEFANAIIGQISKSVKDIMIKLDSDFSILFNDDSIIQISLKKIDCVGPESIQLILKNNHFNVL